MADQLRDLARMLGDLAVSMQVQVDTDATLRALVSGAVDIVPGAHWAGVSLIDGHAVQSRAPSDPVVAKLDNLQVELDDGPCLSALREHRTILIDDMSTETRWPAFAAAAMALDVRSLLSFQLSVAAQNLGALNLYSGESGVFADDSVYIGGIVAQHASVALYGAEAETQFDTALSTRDVIGQAKGIIMERFQVDAPQAFRLLTRLSQESNTKLVEVARLLVASIGASS